MTALLLRPEGAPAPKLSTLPRVSGDTLWSTLGPETLGAPALEIAFPSFKDGRGFTLARELRDRLGYRGWLRASGDLLPDQATHLRDVGFDDVLVSEDRALPAWERAAQRFKRRLQRIAVEASPQTVTPLGDSVEALNARFAALATEAVLEESLRERWPGAIAVLSSFGAEAAVTLHLAAQVDRFVPVLFLDTGKLFPETLAYQRALVQRLGLGNVRVIKPSPAALASADPQGDLWTRDCNACCALRKVEPLAPEAEAFSVLITGRKRVHGNARQSLPVLERQGAQLRLNPLAAWSEAEVDAYFERYELPRHPLWTQGYRSLGCAPCTAPAGAAGPRSGRWAGQGKTECGIHRPQVVTVR
jgi:phosphoadenosine phosphosulfate reductase